MNLITFALGNLTIFLSLQLNFAAKVNFLSIDKCFSSNNATIVFHLCAFGSKGLNVSYEVLEIKQTNAFVSIIKY